MFAAFYLSSVGCEQEAIRDTGPEVLVTTQETYLTIEAQPADKLPQDKKCRLAAGTQIAIKDVPQWVTNHMYKVSVLNINGETYEGSCSAIHTGYLYGPHVGLMQPFHVVLVAQQDTYLKRLAKAVEELSSTDKCFVPEGTEIKIRGYLQSYPDHNYHLEIENISHALCKEVADAFIDGSHFGIADPPGKTYPVLQDTFFTRSKEEQPAKNSPDSCVIPQGSILVLDKEIPAGADPYYRTNVASFLNCPFMEGFIYLPHLGVMDDNKPEPKPQKPEPQKPDPVKVETWGERFVEFYESNWDQIKNEVGFTSNACAAFATTALRMFGVDFQYETWVPTLVELFKSAGWEKVTEMDQLKAGDFIITKGFTHVFVFAGFAEGTTISWAIDNQGNKHRRELYGSGNYDPFMYAFRYPDP